MGGGVAIAALGALGIKTTSILASLGVAGLTLGFAAKDTLSNIIAGIFIFWDRPFSVWIKNEREHVIERFAMRELVLNTLRGGQVNMPYETFAVLSQTQESGGASLGDGVAETSAEGSTK